MLPQPRGRVALCLVSNAQRDAQISPCNLGRRSSINKRHSLQIIKASTEVRRFEILEWRGTSCVCLIVNFDHGKVVVDLPVIKSLFQLSSSIRLHPGHHVAPESSHTS